MWTGIVFFIGRSDLLELQTRRTVFEYVQKFPGLHLREIARGTSLHPNHVKYHLQYLAKHQVVSSRKEGGYWRFFPKEQSSVGMRETVGADQKHLLSLLRQPVPLHATLVLLERRRVSQGDLAQAVGVAQATLHYHLGKMERANLVRSWKEGRERIYEVADEPLVQELLLKFRPPDALVSGFLDAWESMQLDVRRRKEDAAYEEATAEPEPQDFTDEELGVPGAQGQAEGEG